MYIRLFCTVHLFLESLSSITTLCSLYHSNTCKFIIQTLAHFPFGLVLRVFCVYCVLKIRFDTFVERHEKGNSLSIGLKEMEVGIKRTIEFVSGTFSPHFVSYSFSIPLTEQSVPSIYTPFF